MASWMASSSSSLANYWQKIKKKKMGRIIYAIERGVWLPYGFPLSSGSF
jgi:hypothetical protein